MNLNNMKRIGSLIAIMLGICLNTIAQNNTVIGVYKSYQDFKSGTPTYSLNCNSNNAIKLNDFISSCYIDINVGGKKIKLDKDSIYGYKNCKNETYRFYKKHDEEFLILESKGIIIYASYVDVSSNNGKTNNRVEEYFFSKTEDSEILPLTLINLKKAFPSNLKFHDMLDEEFSGGKPLNEYSKANHIYEINLLLNQSTIN